MKTLITLIFCLFVVDAANADDKWEYITIETRFSKKRISGEDTQQNVFIINGQYTGTPFKNSIMHWKTLALSLKDEKHEYVLPDKTIQEENLKLFGKPLKKSFLVSDYLNFYGNFGFELVSAIPISRHEKGYVDKTKYILKRAVRMVVID